VLLIGSFFVVLEAIQRIITPEHVDARGMLLIAVFGIALNGIAALRLHKGKSLNQQVLTWHILEDVFGWLVILIGSILLLFWDNHLIDPIMSLGFTVYIIWGVSKRLKETFNIFMEGVPKGMDVPAIKQAIGKLPGVEAVHDIHVWSLEGETNLFTGHIVVEANMLSHPNEMKQAVRILLLSHQIQHATIELETPDYCSGPECELPSK
jgi:cobalt-zinc-cadmium efflux system protein